MSTDVSDGPTDCPNCGGEMVEDSRERNISISFSGPEGADEMDMDAGDSDVIGWVCVECGHKETTEQRGETDVDEEDEED